MKLPSKIEKALLSRSPLLGASSWLCCLNYYLLQFLFFRLARIVSEEGQEQGFEWTLLFARPFTGWVKR